MNKAIFFLMMIGAIFQNGLAQKENVCDCCTLSWMQSQHHFDEIFPPEIILKNKISSILVSRKSKHNLDSNAKKTDSKMELEFYFYSNGFVKSITFYQNGIPNFLSEYQIEGEQKYKNKLIYLIDSTGKKITTTPQEIWFYEYRGNLLTKVIKTDANGQIKPDSVSDYIQYNYDSLNRVVFESEQMYSFASTPMFNFTKTKYDDSNLSASSITGTKDFIITESQLSFNTQKKLIYEKLMENKSNRTIREKFIQYNKLNQIERIELKSYQELTDCPDGGNYIDQFSRNEMGLFKQIIHTYNAYTCTLDFLYRR